MIFIVVFFAKSHPSHPEHLFDNIITQIFNDLVYSVLLDSSTCNCHDLSLQEEFALYYLLLFKSTQFKTHSHETYSLQTIEVIINEHISNYVIFQMLKDKTITPKQEQ